MTKKGKKIVKAYAFEYSEMHPLFSDTTCNKYGGTTSWEAMHNVLEDENPKVLEFKATTDAKISSEVSYFEATCSFLHKIAARPKILPYTDMVKWIKDNVDISDRTFWNSRQEIMGSF